MRITIDEDTFNKILSWFQQEDDIFQELVLAREKYEQSNTDNKKDAMNRARKTKEVDAHKKVANAINLAKLQGLAITPGIIAELADVHYYTARKYIELENK